MGDDDGFRPNRDSGQELVEGFARVVAIEAGVAWLEPEPNPACGGCLSSALCGSKSGGQDKRLAARRFALPDAPPLRLGERVVVGAPPEGLLRAALLVYGLPLLTMLGGGVIAQGMGAGDGVAMIATGCGLALGVLAARLGAGRLTAGGRMAPQFIRRFALDRPPPQPSPACGGEPGPRSGRVRERLPSVGRA